MPKSFEITLRQNSEPSTRLERNTKHASTRHHAQAAVLPCNGGTSAVARRGWEAPREPTSTCAPPMRPVSRSSRWTPRHRGQDDVERRGWPAKQKRVNATSTGICGALVQVTGSSRAVDMEFACRWRRCSRSPCTGTCIANGYK